MEQTVPEINLGQAVKPSLHIPAQPEYNLHGLTQQLAPRILACSKGGFVVIFEGLGVAGKSTWGEVVHCIEDVGRDHLGIVDPEPVIPPGIDPTLPERPSTMSDGVTMHSTLLWIGAAITSALVLWSTRIS